MNLLALPPFLPLQSLFPSFVLEALGAVVCQTVDPFVQLALLENVHCNESLVWLKASAVWYTTITKFSPHLLWDFPRLPQVPEILWVLFHRTSPSEAPAGLRRGGC